MTTKIRCKICRKKLNSLLIETFTCKCGNYYCKENHFFDHNCTFDYLENNKKFLQENIPVIVGEKVKRI